MIDLTFRPIWLVIVRDFVFSRHAEFSGFSNDSAEFLIFLRNREKHPFTSENCGKRRIFIVSEVFLEILPF